jgi:dTDP-4-amino-4,6-dideoxygalactose transaminase
MEIPFNDLRPLHAELAGELAAAASRVLSSGWFVLGPELSAFESAFAAWHGVPHAAGVANGTDAIELALRAAGIGAGDEVITVAHTAMATVTAVERAGARPVLVDVDEATYTMHPAAAAAAVTPRTKAIVPVHLYGHPADLPPLLALAERHGLTLLEDCAQAHGARLEGRLVGTFGRLAAFSFYPTKNLGALGDAGAILSADPDLDARLRRLRHYGQRVRYHHDERGMNSRLDELQAALLAVKLAHLSRHTEERRRLAALYTEALAGSGVTRPAEREGASHAWHLYVIRHPRRDALAEALKRRGVGTLVHYPIPVHRQASHRDLGLAEGSLPVTERVAKEVLSLPFYIGLSDADVHRVAGAVRESAREVGGA